MGDLTLPRDLSWFAFTWLAYRFVLIWPHGGPYFGFRHRVFMAVLPYAGLYANSTSWAHFRQNIARRTALKNQEG